MNKPGWFVPLAIAVTCIPCLLLPLAAVLIASGAAGTMLAFLGVPWILALIIAVPIGLALLFLRRRRRAAACCDVPHEAGEESARLSPASTKHPVEHR